MSGSDVTAATRGEATPPVVNMGGPVAGVHAARVPLLRSALLSRQAAMTGIAGLIFLYLALDADHFLELQNLIQVAQEMAYVAIAAVGMTYLFIAGEFDLSVGSLLSAAQVLFGWLIITHHMNPWLAALVTLAFGVLVGGVNGGVSVYFGVPSMVTTLGMLSLLSGAALVVTGEFPIDMSQAPNSGVYRLVGGQIGSGNDGVPSVIIWMVGICFVGGFVLRKTRFGYNVFASGGNVRAARAMGINTSRVKLKCFMLVSVLTSFVAIADVGWLRNASPIAGTNYLFTVMGAVILGGISATGGEGSVYGSFIGAFILSLLVDGLVLLGVNGDYNTVVTGAIIIIAGMLTVGMRRYGARGARPAARGGWLTRAALPFSGRRRAAAAAAAADVPGFAVPGVAPSPTDQT
jgi:ribose transport system permease protein